MATNIAEAINDLVTALRDAGIAATAEPSKVEFPGVLVTPGTLTFPYLDDSQFNMEFNLFLVGSNQEAMETWIELQDLLQKVRSVFGVLDATPINKPFNNTSRDPVPALLVTLQTTIS